MAWNADVLAIRDWVGATVRGIWPGITVAYDQPALDPGVPMAMINIKEVEFRPDTVSTDRLNLAIVATVRRMVATGGVSNALLADAGALRSALLSSPNPADVGDSPLVGRVEVRPGRPGYAEPELSLEFHCSMSAGRQD